ncbi:IS110 family transposase [Iamia majanohamensis]|uniref:IS110 family transposase n=1 Tax=Iamia majanohamensis TaxID=467976 RepID=A0AAE9Y674_9ACTN|nr:IS110 family transposase [Iamia majanohamensis]WCO65058.1 IS110 family transposase [Iamia majanohamensis]
MQLKEMVSHVIGVDTHRDTHTAGAVDAVTGAELALIEVQTNRDGFEELIEFADTHAPAEDRAWAIEGTGSYGAGLTEFLSQRGELVIEVDRPTRPATRNGSKSDPLDAVRAARQALARTTWATPRARGEREAMRVLATTRASAVRDRTRAINQLKAMIVSAPEDLKDQLRALGRQQLIDRCARLRPCPTRPADHQATSASLRRLARRIHNLDDEIRDHDRDLRALTETHCPQLLAQAGVGPVTAAQIYISWSHPGRCRNEAAFASLAGTAPIEASSGQITRHRLNRGGDRQLNRALHTIVLTRTRHDPATQAYIAKRTAENKTNRDARRCLKRYLARRLFRLLENPPPLLDT